MMICEDIDNLGTPNILIAGLNIWVRERVPPTPQHGLDANWLNLTVACSAKGAAVCIHDLVIQILTFQEWAETCEVLHRFTSREATLKFSQELTISMERRQPGPIEMTVYISPDFIRQEHSFLFDIEQSDLESLIRDCKKILMDYPISNEHFSFPRPAPVQAKSRRE